LAHGGKCIPAHNVLYVLHLCLSTILHSLLRLHMVTSATENSFGIATKPQQ
jgi:hypothetical protein